MDLLKELDLQDLLKHQRSKIGLPLQSCPNCERTIGALAGGRDATCNNCGYKDPCCE